MQTKPHQTPPIPEQGFTSNEQIISVWPSKNACFAIEDCTSFDEPKLRFVIIPAGTNKAKRAQFFLGIHDARALFVSLRSGELTEPALSSNKEGVAIKGYDRYTQVKGGRRTLTIKKKGKETGILIVEKYQNVDAYQAIYISRYATQMIALAVIHFIQSLDARTLLRTPK